MTARTLFAGLAVALAAFAGGAHATATITVVNLDGAGEGFNDPTVVAPVGGNTGTTLGQQRLIAFQYAADLWGQLLNSGVTIVVNAQMNPLFCSPTSAVLGSAGTTTVHRDFSGAPVANTWYSQALANSLAGSDLSGNADLSAQFNSNINGSAGCLGGLSWYYGLDANPGSDIDFVTVVLHEIGHGLGFQTFVNQSGQRFNGFNDTYMLNLQRIGASARRGQHLRPQPRVERDERDRRASQRARYRRSEQRPDARARAQPVPGRLLGLPLELGRLAQRADGTVLHGRQP
jgi:hypothetical protein